MKDKYGITHQGLNRHRLIQNQLEEDFADKWEQFASDNLGPLLKAGDIRHIPTQEEATIAATIIQWLGSPVGQHFLTEVYGD
jgi:hypothetical protein